MITAPSKVSVREEIAETIRSDREAEKVEKITKGKLIDMDDAMNHIKYFMEHQN